MDIKNINFGGIVPDKRMTVANGKAVEIKRTYKVVNGAGVIIWDIGNTPEPPAVNEFIITIPTTEQDSKYYIALFAMETTDNRHRGAIDWGDGSEEIYWSDAAYSHEYSESGTKTVKIYAPIEQLYSSSAAGVFYSQKIEYIKFPDSAKKLGYHAFNACYRIADIDFNNVEDIMNNAFYRSPCYFPYEPYNHYIDLDLTNVKYIRSQAFNNCTALQSINISDAIEIIESNAFYNCNHLTSITINKPLNSIAGAPWGATNAEVIWTG